MPEVNEFKQANEAQESENLFRPPKRWDGKKVKSRRGYGYPDENGKIWVPTGPGSGAHGGPHWDVQFPNGDYDNVMPGGHSRGKGPKK